MYINIKSWFIPDRNTRCQLFLKTVISKNKFERDNYAMNVIFSDSIPRK